MREVALQGFGVFVRQRPEASRERGIAEIGRGLKIGVFKAIEAQHHVAATLNDRRVHADASDAVLHIGRVARLRLLTIADNVYAACDLLRDDRPYGLGRSCLERGFVQRLAGLAGGNEVEHRARPRQTADMRGQDAIGAELHRRFLPLLG